RSVPWKPGPWRHVSGLLNSEFSKGEIMTIRTRLAKLETQHPAPPPGDLRHLTDKQLVARLRSSLPRQVRLWRAGNPKAASLVARLAAPRAPGMAELYPVGTQLRAELRALLTSSERKTLGIPDDAG
ncbi:MAG: hypothetical protein ABID40_00650, partial [Candidatus Bipolaricaulota bacterium]